MHIGTHIKCDVTLLLLCVTGSSGQPQGFLVVNAHDDIMPAHRTRPFTTLLSIHSPIMGNRAKSQEEKKIIRRREIDELYARAKDIYIQEHGDTTTKGRSYRTICDEVSQAHFEQTGHMIGLSTSTLQQHVNGGKPKSKTNAEKGWVTEEESELIVSFVSGCAEMI